ncbi:acyl-CoA dehydrogenase family protein [Actinokineospora enzanensis]|uniref:acyl-CoA dehydrogenase family protein n=1 Tax=Actinokineospora enzanensis TaxID=155975 RepID=UPI0003721A11|nr:acyl-CoA dehydrogenase family protein [Actinokineospora enzanensis]
MTGLAAAVTEHGSPLYVYDLAEVTDAVTDLREHLPGSALLFYSLKANANPAVLTELARLGCRAEISSGGELAAALAAGFTPEACLFTGPGKTAAEIADALAAGVVLFSAESLVELRRVAEAGRAAHVVPRCLLRIDPGTSDGDAGIRMGGAAAFGLDADRADEWAPAALAEPDVTLVGLHLFTASNARGEEALITEFRANLTTAARLHADHGLPLDLLDLGGGFATPYATPGARPAYPGLAAAIAAFALPARTRLAFESGRYLVGSCGTLVTTVLDVREARAGTHVVLDSGINHLGGLTGLRRMLPPRIRAEVVTGGGPEAQVTLIGPLCTPADVLARDVRMPLPAPGDVLAVPNTGAYGLSASLVGFLGRALPAEIVVRGDTVVSATRQEMTRHVVRSPDPVAAAEKVVPVLRACAGPTDEKAEFPLESLAALRSGGLMGLLVPRAYGGLGLGPARLADVVRVLAGACTSTAMAFAMHCQQVDALVRFGSAALRDRVLPRVAAGEVYLASITSERSTGGDLFTAHAPLRRNGEELVVERDAPVVTGGAHADGYLVTMRSADDAPETSVSLVYIARAQATVAATGGWDPLGMRATASAPLRLTARVPADQVVGVPGRFRDVAVASFTPIGMIGWAACWLGTAHQALRDVVGLFRSPGRPAGADLSSHLVHERVAVIRHDLELVSGYLSRVVDEVELCRARGDDPAGGALQAHLTCLKVTAAELTYRAVDRCVQLAGLGQGYQRGSSLPLERNLRDLRSAAMNCSNDWLLRANGVLTLADRAITLA